jgi:hypothetical protein
MLVLRQMQQELGSRPVVLTARTGSGAQVNQRKLSMREYATDIYEMMARLGYRSLA